MAEVTGQIGNEYVELDNAATEATLQELLKATAAMAKSAKVDVKDAQKEIDNLYKSSKKLNPQLLRKQAIERKTAKQDKKAFNDKNSFLDNEEEYNEAKEQTTKSLNRAENFVNSFGKGINQSVIGLFGFADKLAGMGDSLPAAASALGAIPIVGGMLSGVFGAVAGSAERLFTSFQTAAGVGATFGGSVTKMVKTASDAGLTFDQFANIVSKNAEGLALLGEGTESGAKEFGLLAKGMRESMTKEGLANLGFSAESAQEGMARYVSRLARSGQAQGRQTDDLVASSTEYLKNLDALSKLTGKSKDELQTQADALQNEAKYRALLAKADPKSRDELERLMLSVPEGMRAGAMEVLATGTATTEAGQQYLAFMHQSGQGLAEAGALVRSGGQLSADATNDLINQVTSEAKELADSPLGETLAMFVPEMDAFMVSAFDASQRAGDVAKLREQTDNAAKQSTDELAKSLVKAKANLSEFSNQITKLLGENIGHLETVINFSIKVLEKVLVPAIELLNNHFGKIAIAVGALATVIAAAKGVILANQLANAVRGAGAGAGGAAKAGGGMMAGLSKAAAGAARFAGPVALIATAGMAIHGAAKGAGQAAENFSLAEGEVATMGQKVASGFGGAIQTLTFGLVDGPWVARGVHSVGSALGDGFNSVKDGVTKLWQNPEEVMKGLGDSIANGFSRARDFVTGMWTGMKESKLGEAITEGFTFAKSSITSWGQSIARGFDSIKNINLDTTALASGWNKVTGFFNRSPSEVVDAVKDQPAVAAATTPQTGTAASPAMGGQNSVETLISNLNTRLDRLIALNTEIITVNQQQLNVQKGLTNDLYASV